MVCWFTIDLTCRTEPMRRMQVIAIWKTTRPRVSRPTWRDELPRPESLRVEAESMRDEMSAGIRPETRAATRVEATLTRRARPLISKTIQRGGPLFWLRKEEASQSTDR